MIFPFLRRAFALLFLVSPGAAGAQGDTSSDSSFLGPLGPPLRAFFANDQILPWIAGVLAVAAIVLLVAHRLRLKRRAARVQITGLRNGPRFRVVDAMCHAVWKGRKIDEARLARTLEIARDTTNMDFTIDHMREVALRADRLIIPANFHWMREGLKPEEKLVVFNTTVSVLLADGPLTRSDRAFLRTVARGLRLGRKQLRHLAHLVLT